MTLIQVLIPMRTSTSRTIRAQTSAAATAAITALAALPTRVGQVICRFFQVGLDVVVEISLLSQLEYFQAKYANQFARASFSIEINH